LQHAVNLVDGCGLWENVFPIPDGKWFDSPLPNRSQSFRLCAICLRYDEAARLGDVEDAAVGDDGAEAFARIDCGAGRDELAAGREIDHVHVGAQDVRLGEREAATGIVVPDAADHFARLAVEDVSFASQGVGKDEPMPHADGIQRGCDRVRLPDERAILGVETPDKSVLGGLARLIVAADVQSFPRSP